MPAAAELPNTYPDYLKPYHPSVDKSNKFQFSQDRREVIGSGGWASLESYVALQELNPTGSSFTERVGSAVKKPRFSTQMDSLPRYVAAIVSNTLDSADSSTFALALATLEIPPMTESFKWVSSNSVYDYCRDVTIVLCLAEEWRLADPQTRLVTDKMVQSLRNIIETVKSHRAIWSAKKILGDKNALGVNEILGVMDRYAMEHSQSAIALAQSSASSARKGAERSFIISAASPSAALAKLENAVASRETSLRGEGQRLDGLQLSQTTDLGKIRAEIQKLETLLEVQRAAESEKQGEIQTTQGAMAANKAILDRLPDFRARIAELKTRYEQAVEGKKRAQTELIQSYGGEEQVSVIRRDNGLVRLLLDDGLLNTWADGTHVEDIKILTQELDNQTILMNTLTKTPGLEGLNQKSVEGILKILATQLDNLSLWSEAATAGAMVNIVKGQLATLRELVKSDILLAERARIAELYKSPALPAEFEALAKELNASIKIGMPATVTSTAAIE